MGTVRTRTRHGNSQGFDLSTCYALRVSASEMDRRTSWPAEEPESFRFSLPTVCAVAHALWPKPGA